MSKTINHEAAVQCLAPVGDVCGEGALWSAHEGAVYWTDVCRFLIHRLHLASCNVRSWLFDEPVVGLSLVQDDERLLVALGSKLLLWHPATDTRTDHGFALDGWPGTRLNEGRTAPNGDFWIGSMGNNVGPQGELVPLPPGRGQLFHLGAGGPRVLKRGLGISNTMCWSPDEKTFYFGDTSANCIWAWDYDKDSGTISRERVFFEAYARGKPDGSCMDAEGCLWNTRFGGACVVRITPQGKVDRVLEMPVQSITTCAFGGAALDTMFITTARLLAPETDRLAGSLFAFTPSVGGAPAYSMRLPA
jgi:sugar lactone lactonase YvrE